MNDDRTAREIVNQDYRTADVFKKWGINYCCGGNIPLNEVCEQQNLDRAVIEKDLEKAVQTVNISNSLSYDEWPLDFLIDYIIYIHHGYIKQTTPVLSDQLRSFVAGHIKKYPYLDEVQEVFFDLAAELFEHVKNEEEVIFPYLKQISNTYRRKEVYGRLFVSTLRKPLADMVGKEHNRIAALLTELRRATNNYIFDSNACTNHRVIYHKLKEFDGDLVQHKHLENNVLIPKALQMEKELLDYRAQL